MSMWGAKDDDEKYDDYLKEDGSMFGKMDRSEWQQKEDRAKEIASGLTSGMFERDEEVLERVRKLKEEGK